MKTLWKVSAAFCGILMLTQCSEDSSSNSTGGSANSLCASAVLEEVSRVVNLGEIYSINKENVVRDARGNVIGNFADGFIYDEAGTPIFENVDLSQAEVCATNAVLDPSTGEVVPVSSSSEVPENPSEDIDEPAPTSSATQQILSSESSENTPPAIADSSTTNPEISSSSTPEPSAGGFKDIADYGAPPAEYTKDISGNGKRGWNTRYWDACKPHCSWISNGAEGKTDTTTQESYVAGMTTARNCNIHDVEVPTFTLGHAVQQYWMGYEGTTSACEIGAAGVFTCTDMAPIAVNENLSYAYVAGPGASTSCGKCFHLQYDGSFKDESGTNAPKETHKALKGKHIIVMTSNIGHDVAEGQFDLMVPGGGVGIFDALSTQVNGAGVDWGAQYGGFLTKCQQNLGYDASLNAYQTCIKDMCDAAFANSGYPNLLRGCHWFADWYMAADNPTYNWEEVECPQYLIDHYMTTINTEKSNNFRWHDDWSTFKEGDELETQECLTEEYPQGCAP